ncbi:hypothetical protein DT075_33835 [Bacillus licheniformis]|nr:hypothetical protein DT075_33835 [Bacillus licheniformis]
MTSKANQTMATVSHIVDLPEQAFQTGLDKTLTELKNQTDEISKVKQSIKGLTSLDDALKGAGGEAIRSFYEECHTTFLLFYESFISP